MRALFSLILLTTSSLAGSLSVVSSPYDYQAAPPYQAILAHLKSFGEFSSKEKPEEKTTLKVLSRGERMVEEAKARNRAILAAKISPEKKESLTELEKWKKEEKETLAQWKKGSLAELNAWKREQEIFLGRIKVYKENTFVIPAKAEKIVEPKIPTEAIPDVFVVNGAFSVPVRDQSARPTCVAFAGVRAIEIILSQNNALQDLSEQYIYWAGKPKCQVAPCEDKGSWIIPAYRHSQSQANLDIPLETNCAYQGSPLPQNETQIPLSSSCKEGAVRVESFEEVKTLAEVVQKIKQNTPVIVAARLSENFYRNKGLVTLKDSEVTSPKKLDHHSLGHAFLAVGLLELPEVLKPKEGNFCLLVANSWGEGWGRGGHACVTENWLLKYRQPSAFVSVTKVSVK